MSAAGWCQPPSATGGFRGVLGTFLRHLLLGKVGKLPPEREPRHLGGSKRRGPELLDQEATPSPRAL